MLTLANKNGVARQEHAAQIALRGELGMRLGLKAEATLEILMGSRSMEELALAVTDGSANPAEPFSSFPRILLS